MISQYDFLLTLKIRKFLVFIKFNCLVHQEYKYIFNTKQPFYYIYVLLIEMEFKKYSIVDIADIRFGSNEKTDPHGSVAFIMAKNFNDDFSFSKNSLHFIYESQLKERALLQPNDILLAGKGNIFAVQWKGEVEPAVASGTFFVLRIKDKNILPEYLTWYLNSEGAQKQFANHVKTTTVPYIKISALDEIKIPILTIEKQKTIVVLSKLMRDEKKLNDELLLQKEKLLNHIL